MEIKAPDEIKRLLENVVNELRTYLGENLTGVYLYGSLTFGCFNPVSSDIDIQVVINKSLTDDDKNNIVTLLKIPTDKIPTKKLSVGFVELDVLKNFKHPAAQTFYVSGTGADGFEIENEQVSQSLTTHLRTIKERGVPLYGEPTENIFPNISNYDYLKSIISNFDWCYNNVSRGEDTGECRVPTYATLNFCRVLAFMKDGIVTSKLEGGEWGLKYLPEEFGSLIREALNEYTETGSSKLVDCANLKKFANYTREKILENNHEK